MGDLKPIGSEKLQGDDKIKRILELTYYKQNTVNENNTTKKAELIKESSNGVYGIVREKDGYYVKKGLNEGTLDYIGGLFMKNKNRFNSYAEALKRLELLKSQEINEDVTKYVLKQNKSKQEASLPQDSVDAMPPALPPADSSEPSPEPMAAPTDSAPQDASPEPSIDDSGMSPSSEEGKRSDYMAEVQKFAGKLGQELRDQQPKMESDDIKYVLNMIISAVDLDKLEDDDIEEIGKKFERDEEMTSEPEAAGEPEPEMEPAPEEDDSDEKTKAAPEDDLAERISKLEELINTKFYSEEEKDLTEYDDYFPDVDSAYEDKTHLDYDPMDDYQIDNKPPRMYDDEDEEDIAITPELDDINESINTTLSKYFE